MLVVSLDFVSPSGYEYHPLGERCFWLEKIASWVIN